MPSERHIDWHQLMETALTTPGDMAGVYDRFHDYSLTNMLLFRLQGIREPIASRSRWQSLGRHILRGTKAKQVIVPVLINEPAPEEETIEEQKEHLARLIGFKVVRAIFTLSDTDGAELPHIQVPGWNKDLALSKLGIREMPFEEMNGNIQGYSSGVEIAVNPVAVHPAKTLMHELGHVVLGHTLPHTFEEYTTHRGIMEFQAEAVAYLAMNELGQLDDDTASASRGYIRHWLRDERPPDKAIQQVFTATDRILRAGRLAIPRQPDE